MASVTTGLGHFDIKCLRQGVYFSTTLTRVLIGVIFTGARAKLRVPTQEQPGRHARRTDGNENEFFYLKYPKTTLKNKRDPMSDPLPVFSCQDQVLAKEE